MDPKLYQAAEEGDLDYLQKLEQPSHLHEKLTPCKETILHVATENHKTEFIERALELCPPLLILANSSGNTAMHIAAGEGNKELVDLFMKRSSDIESGEHKDHVITRMVNCKKDTALHCAARIGSYECAKMLAEADPDVCSFVNNDDESPIYLLVASGCWSKDKIIVTDELASSFTAAAYQGPVGLTALHASVLFRLDGGYKPGEIEKLVKWRKEMITKGDDLGMTPLHYAAFYGRTDVVESFVRCCSDAIHLTNKEGQTALHLAAYNGCVNVLQQLVLFRHDCYNMVDEKGRTALHAAVLGKQKEAVEFILKTPRLERLINKSDTDGDTPLHLAARFKFVHIIQIIVSKKNVRFNIVNNKRLTPLQLYSEHKPVRFTLFF
ncbi:ankyrin repeat-containing protein [Cucumis melo var. makuwa]|uniref:Ankyrin repeat-containing protein n=1 Tax=Cucumis melo var. makuwa TaxID=1194695 RepID=A0A5D3D4H9_CUCMM|nr:ankyrin repeat-containing protein [Cucumis melo var. makuwa]